MDLPPIVFAYLDAYNRRDVEALVACVSNDVVVENVSNSGPPSRIEGRDAFSASARQGADLFAERRQTVRTAVVSGEHVALDIDWTGTLAIDVGPFQAGRPAGRAARPILSGVVG